MQSYDMLVEKIAKAANLEKEEVERRIEAKKAKLSGLISKEGAAQIVSAELGVSFDNETFKIHELMPGMKKVNVTGKLINMFPIRQYNKNGKEGKVANLIIADETGSIRAVLWDTNHIALLEKNEICLNDVIEIKNAMMRENEMHLTNFSEIKKSSQIIENIKTTRPVAGKTIIDIQEGQSVKVRGLIVQFFPPRFFSVCSQCGKKAIQEADGYSCAEHGKIAPKERALVNFVLDDGTETLRVVMFSEQINKFVDESLLKDAEKLSIFREDLLGSEFNVSGIARKNQMFNNIELIASDVEKVDVDKLIEELEKV
jgi:ssDNA-binding replication factor A large subunit